MVRIASYVFFDIETTGLPWQERNRTKITELCFVAAAREDLQKSTGYIPPVSKLSMLLNPQKKIHPEVTAMTGLTNEFLTHAPTFNKISGSVVHFLNDLPRPICLIAHNGNTFDYKIFLAECKDARVSLPDDIYCVDSLAIFRKILKDPVKTVPNNLEDLWPELNVTPEDWDEIDKLCSPIKKKCVVSVKDNLDVSNITDDEDSDLDEKIFQCEENERKKSEAIKKLFINNGTNSVETKKKGSNGTITKQNNGGRKGAYTLSGLYERLLNKNFVDAHRAENDCFALLECVIAKKEDFLTVADDCCKILSEIQPLQRY